MLMHGPADTTASTAEDSRITNVFTVDVEDYFHVQAFADRIHPKTWDAYPARVVPNTHRILRILGEYNVRATFFVLGWVADRFPRLVRDIQKEGHEIGCHSLNHRLIYDMTPDEFREDLVTATKVIEEITSQPVTAYRAPSFSITNRSLWALDILIEEGYQYDSSVFPVRHDNYGIPDARRFPYVIRHSADTRYQPAGHRTTRLPSHSLREFPPTTYRTRIWKKWNVPVGGGGYLRLYPLRLSLHWLDHINRIEGQPFACYIHPWELDCEQPRLAAGWKSRFRHYQNLKTTERKLRRLLLNHRFAPMSQVVAGAQWFEDETLKNPHESVQEGQEGAGKEIIRSLQSFG